MKKGRHLTYEAQRLKDIIANSKALGEAPTSFRINQWMVRGWEDFLKRWMKHSDAAEDVLLSDIAKKQTKQRGKFGDPHLYSRTNFKLNRAAALDEWHKLLSA